jgi:hypothetical protein
MEAKMGARCFFVLLAAIVLGPMTYGPFWPHSSRDDSPERFVEPRPILHKRTIILPLNEQPNLPPYWEKHQINGMDYYIIPVAVR